MIPSDPEVYQGVSLTHRRSIWTRKGNKQQPIKVREELPLYREVAFIGADGREKIVVKDDQIVPLWALRGIRNPKNTTYLNEHYFEETKNLSAGKIYVSHVAGWCVSQDEQLPGADRVEDAVEGRKFEGVVRRRFALKAF